MEDLVPAPAPPWSAASGKCVFIAGPTAVGKSEVALRLAERIGGEIISVDSMQVYRGMDVGTAKPSPEERSRVPHHLIDICDVTESFDAATFVHLASAAARDILQRGRVPILCGGTGLYFKAFLHGLGVAPASDSTLRSELRQTDLSELLRELQQKDPETHARIDRNNFRRVLRAVEVLRLTGIPFSAQRANWAPPDIPGLAWLFLRSSEELRSRINTRVDLMFQRGLVAETGRLLVHGLEQNIVAMQALGYRQVVEHLRGERDLPQTIDLVKSRTRKFAKRQLTWFRGQMNFTPVALPQDQSPQATADQLAATWERISP